MSANLKTFVEKYLLNPAASFTADDEGNQETKAQVVDSLLDGEKTDVSRQSISKLRGRQAALEAERDPRYQGKKVLRKDLKEDSKVEFDPELAKYYMIEGSEEEEEEGDEVDDEDSEEIDDDEEEEESDEIEDEDGNDDEQSVTNEKLSQKLEKLRTGESDEENSENEECDEEGEENEEIEKLYQQLKSKPAGVTYIDDGDFSKFVDDFDGDEDEEDDSNDGDEGSEGDDEDMDMKDPIIDQEESTLKKFRHEELSEEVKKGQAVKNQFAIYDSLFEGRICLQKMLSGSNQLPQYDTYKHFLREKDPNYIKNLSAAKTATKNLLNTLLHMQELLLKQSPETNHIISGKTPKDAGTESDEEITSSEEEGKHEEEKEAPAGFQGLKRKMSVEDYEDVLSKRHAAMLPFRDQTINKWYEKTKLLSSHSARNRFSGFETSALQQLHNILTNKQQLIRRTQMTGTTRGTTYHILGQKQKTEQLESEEYDGEIFDDTDFYTRALEEVLKAKVLLSDNMMDVSRKWIEIQNLRKKAKKKVDKKASKGRKVRYEVMSKLQQYMAPCYHPRMDDGAINTLFASLFGKAVHKSQRGKGAMIAFLHAHPVVSQTSEDFRMDELSVWQDAGHPFLLHQDAL